MPRAKKFTLSANLRYTYLRNYELPNKQTVGCVIMEVNREAKKINYHFSVCSPKDVFDPKRAVNIAHSKLIERPIVLEGNIPEKGYEITRLIMKDIAAKNEDQNRSRSFLAHKYATAWLTAHADMEQNK